MAYSFAELSFKGTIGMAPDVKFNRSTGAPITIVSIAINRYYKDRVTNEQKETTEWLRLVFGNRGNYKLGEIAQKLKTGVVITGSAYPKTRKYQDKDGKDCFIHEYIVTDFSVVDTMYLRNTTASAIPPVVNAAAAGKSAESQPFDDFDDDIPF
jgi:single-strand DNA-binding protein